MGRTSQTTKSAPKPNLGGVMKAKRRARLTIDANSKYQILKHMEGQRDLLMGSLRPCSSGEQKVAWERLVRWCADELQLKFEDVQHFRKVWGDWKLKAKKNEDNSKKTGGGLKEALSTIDNLVLDIEHGSGRSHRDYAVRTFYLENCALTYFLKNLLDRRT